MLVGYPIRFTAYIIPVIVCMRASSHPSTFLYWWLYTAYIFPCTVSIRTNEKLNNRRLILSYHNSIVHYVCQITKKHLWKIDLQEIAACGCGACPQSSFQQQIQLQHKPSSSPRILELLERQCFLCIYSVILWRRLRCQVHRQQRRGIWRSLGIC